MRRVAVAVVVIAATLIGIWITWATTHEPGPSAADGPRLVVSSLQGEPGDRVTVTGTGCPRDDAERRAGVGAWQIEIWFQPAPGTVPAELDFGDPVMVTNPDRSGRWEATLTVPEWRTEYRLEVGCFDSATPPAGFLYRSEVYTAG